MLRRSLASEARRPPFKTTLIAYFNLRAPDEGGVLFEKTPCSSLLRFKNDVQKEAIPVGRSLFRSSAGCFSKKPPLWIVSNNSNLLWVVFNQNATLLWISCGWRCNNKQFQSSVGSFQTKYNFVTLL